LIVKALQPKKISHCWRRASAGPIPDWSVGGFSPFASALRRLIDGDNRRDVQLFRAFLLARQWMRHYHIKRW
jgi:hypothetical protein